MPEYLVRLVQVHESFRKAELEALAELTGTEMEIISYSEDVRLDFDVLVYSIALNFIALLSVF